jgi:hypothetical protein
MATVAIDKRWLAANERWNKYALRTRGPDFAFWSAEHCLQSTDRFADQPLELEEWQRDITSEMLAELAENEAYWHTAVLIVPKGNGKSTLLAALSLYELVESDGGPEVLLAAATAPQANHLFRNAARFVKRDPWLTARLTIRENDGEIVRNDGFGILRRVSAEGTVAGFNPSLLVCDELKDWSTPKRREAWADLASAGKVKRDHTRVVVISTAGEPHERVDGILGRILDTNEQAGEHERPHDALTISRDHESRTLVFNYPADTLDPLDTDAIKRANPASWVTGHKLAELARSPTHTTGTFMQLHACRWESSAGAFVTFEQWRAAKIDERLNPRDDITLGFRGGTGWALIACRRSDGCLFVVGTGQPGVEDERERATRMLHVALTSYRVSTMFAAGTDRWWTAVDSWRLELGNKRVVEHRVDLHGPRTAELVDRFAVDLASGDIKHSGDHRLSASVLAARLASDDRGNRYLTDDLEHRVPTTAVLAAVLAWEARVTTAPDPQPPEFNIEDFRILPLVDPEPRRPWLH